MKTPHLPEYGHRLCPHCERDFSLYPANPTFGESLCGDVVLYVMCSGCHEQFQMADDDQRKLMSDKCFVSAKLHQHDSNGNRVLWAVTTNLTLFLNGDDLVCAIENGAGLTKQHYFSILSGECDIIQFSSAGIRSVVKGQVHRGGL